MSPLTISKHVNRVTNTKAPLQGLFYARNLIALNIRDDNQICIIILRTNDQEHHLYTD